jgi:two-component system sensor histidine kinase CiaH
VIVYVTFTADLHLEAERHAGTEEGEAAFIESAIADLRRQILMINGVVLVVVTGAGLWLAQRALRPVRENIEAQKRFLATVSHELRTPLAIMKTDFEVALRDPDPAGLAVATRSGLEEIDDMSAMIDDLLLLSRIEARQERLSLAEGDVANVVRRAVDRLAGLAEEHGVTLQATIGAQPRLSIDGDQLQRAVANVIKNAIEHTPSGGRVDVDLRTDGDHVVIVVRDTGAGIAAEELPHIFERFYQADSTRASGGAGSGVGLAIAAWVVESHRGTIEAASEPGAGTRIVMRLPV